MYLNNSITIFLKKISYVVLLLLFVSTQSQDLLLICGHMKCILNILQSNQQVSVLNNVSWSLNVLLRPYFPKDSHRNFQADGCSSEE